MKNTTHKVVILENLSSPYIQQAIIVLKKYSPEQEEKILYDAERIVSEYMKNSRHCENDTKIYKKRKVTMKRRKMSPGVIFTCVSLLMIGVYVISNIF